VRFDRELTQSKIELTTALLASEEAGMSITAVGVGAAREAAELPVTAAGEKTHSLESGGGRESMENPELWVVYEAGAGIDGDEPCDGDDDKVVVDPTKGMGAARVGAGPGGLAAAEIPSTLCGPLSTGREIPSSSSGRNPEAMSRVLLSPAMVMRSKSETSTGKWVELETEVWSWPMTLFNLSVNLDCDTLASATFLFSSSHSALGTVTMGVSWRACCLDGGVERGVALRI
jgi:hypothetical protein